MPDYKALYLGLFNEVTDAIALLQKAQLKSEALATRAGQKPLVFENGRAGAGKTRRSKKPAPKRPPAGKRAT